MLKKSFFSLSFMLVSVIISLNAHPYIEDADVISEGDETIVFRERTSYGTYAAALGVGALAGAGVYVLARNYFEPEIALKVYQYGLYVPSTKQFLQWDNVSDITLGESRRDGGEQHIIQLKDSKGNLLLELSEEDIAISCSELSDALKMFQVDSRSLNHLDTSVAEYDQQKRTLSIFKKNRNGYLPLAGAGVTTLLIGWLVGGRLKNSKEVRIREDGLYAGKKHGLIPWDRISDFTCICLPKSERKKIVITKIGRFQQDDETLEIVIRDSFPKAMNIIKTALRNQFQLSLVDAKKVKSVQSWGLELNDGSSVPWNECLQDVRFEQAVYKDPKKKNKSLIRIRKADSQGVSPYHVFTAGSLACVLVPKRTDRAKMNTDGLTDLVKSKIEQASTPQG